MRKITVVILLTCYLAVTTGFVINFHYCMDRLATARMFETKSKICGQCGMSAEDSNGCCRDEVHVIKLQLDQQTGDSFSYSIFPPEYILGEGSWLPAAQPLQDLSFIQSPVHSPPLLSGQDTYLHNRVFRI